MSRRRFAGTFLALHLLLAAAWGVRPAEAADESGAANGAGSKQQADLWARWDGMLADHDFAGLDHELLAPKNQPEVLAGLAWGKDRTTAGGSVIVPLLYSRMLWLVGTHNPQYAGLEDTASMMALYALALVSVDGVKCADKSAPGNHYEAVLLQYRDQLRLAANAPPDKRDLIVRTAIALEKKTAPSRGDDNYLCRFGLQETQYSLKKHEGEPETVVPPQPGQFGKQVAVPYDKEFQPQFLPRSQWQPQQDAARAAFPQALSALLDKIKSSPPP